MKKLVLSLFSVVSLSSFAQFSVDNMYLDVNLGLRSGGRHSDLTKLGSGFHVDGCVGYDLNSNYGVRGDLAFDIFNAKVVKSDASDKSLLTRLSLQGVVNVGELAGFATDKFGLKFHGGIGFATNSNPNFKDKHEPAGGFKDKGFKGNDDMFTVVFGLNPQYHVNEKISVNLDLSLVILTGQSNVDLEVARLEKGTGSIFNTAVGISYKL